MSGRSQSRALTPARPKSLSPKRRPLHQRSDSEINERSPPARPLQSVRGALGRNDQENGPSMPTPSFNLPKIHTTSPFPEFESQILRPFPDFAAQIPSDAGRVATTGATPSVSTQTPALTYNRHATVTTPVISDQSTLSSPRAQDSVSHDDSYRFSIPSFSVLPELSLDEAGLITPASTIRIVDDTPSTGSRHVAMTNSTVSNSAQSIRSFNDDDYSPSISDLPSLPRDNRFYPAAETPTPATRQYRPTIRTIADLQSEATQTPGSARSANSSGTQVHRRARAADDLLPRGSYLHYAERRVRRSLSNPELADSSPNVQAWNLSASPSPNVRRYHASPDSSPNVLRLGESPLSSPRREARALERDSRNFSSPLSDRSELSPDRFPALTRYVQAARETTRSPMSPNRADMLTSPRRRFRPAHQRWSSAESMSISDYRPVSSEMGSVMGAVMEERPSRLESALSVSIASAHPSIRLVDAGESSPAQSSFLEPPQPRQTPRARFYEVRDTPEVTTNSPVWVSYSSPMTHLPYIDPDSTETLPTPEVSRANLGQLSESASTSDSQGHTPTSPNPQDIIFPSNSSHQDVRVPGMRRRSTMRNTATPIFSPGSSMGHFRQSTISHSPTQSLANSHSGFDLGALARDREPVTAATSAYQPSPDPSKLSPMVQSTAATPSPRFNDSISQEWSRPRIPLTPPARSPMRPRLPFPGGLNSAGNTPNSIHIPRNRPNDSNQQIYISSPSHTRNQTFGGEQSPGLRSSGYSRRSSSPTVPSIDYRDEDEPASSVIRMPFTPPSHIVRPGNPTPGVSPATIITSPGHRTLQIEAMVHADDQHDHHKYDSPLPAIAPLRPPRPKTMSFLVPSSGTLGAETRNLTGSSSSSDSNHSAGVGPSGASHQPTITSSQALPQSERQSHSHRQSHPQFQSQSSRHAPHARDILLSHPHDWTPHLWHGAPHTLNRRSAFIAPSVDTSSAPFLQGSRARRDLQVLLFLLGFLLPPCWLVASLLPLPGFGKVEGMGAFGGQGGGRAERLGRGRSVLGMDGADGRNDYGRRGEKGKSVLGINALGGDLEKEVRWNADQVAGYESCRYWRRVNRGLSVIGLGFCLVLIVVGVVTSQGKIKGS